MDSRQLLKWSAVARAATGGAYLLAPKLLGRAWIGDDGGRRSVGPITMAFASRDVAIGLGLLGALRRDDAPLKGWVVAGILGDAADAIGTVLAGDSIPSRSRRLVALVAGGSALAHLAIAAQLGDD